MADLVQISTVSEEDFEDIATIISRAMAADLIDFFQFGNNYEKAMEIKRTLCRNTFPNSLADPQTRIFKASLRENAKVVAFASVRFHTAEMPTGTESPSGFPPGMNQDFCALYYGAIGAKKQQHLAGQKHVSWGSLHVLPEYQRMGIGSALLEWGFQQFNLEKEKVWLGTQMRGRNLYRRYGWEDVDHVDIDLSDWGGKYRGYGIHRSPLMLRQPGRFQRVEGIANE